MASNGGTISEKTRVPLSFVVALTIIISGSAGSFWAVKSALAQHSGNYDVHHSTQSLDATYLRKDLNQEQMRQLTEAIQDLRVEVRLLREER